MTSELIKLFHSAVDITRAEERLDLESSYRLTENLAEIIDRYLDNHHEPHIEVKLEITNYESCLTSIDVYKCCLRRMTLAGSLLPKAKTTGREFVLLTKLVFSSICPNAK